LALRPSFVGFCSAGLDLFEQQVERHDLGQRCRVARFVGTDLVQHEARFVVDHDVGIGRMIIGTVNGAWTGMVALRLDTRLRRIAAGSGNRQRGHETGKREPMRARDPSPHLQPPVIDRESCRPSKS